VASTPEDGYVGVADALLDRAAVALDRLLRGLEVASHHVSQALGVDPLAERGRAGDVTEEDGHRLARLARRLGGESGAAGVAEAGLLAIFSPAARANGHPASLGRDRVAEFREALADSTGREHVLFLLR